MPGGALLLEVEWVPLSEDQIIRTKRVGPGLILDSAASIDGKGSLTAAERRRWAADHRRFMKARRAKREAAAS